MTELCNGTLDGLVKGRYDSPSVCSNRLIVRQIAKGLRYLHTNGVIHRDLKPDNILISILKGSGDRPVLKLADFGMSRIVPEGQNLMYRTKTKVGDYSIVFRPIGTYGWIAPEIITDKPKYMAESVDIFPLGLIFAFTLSGGRHPFGEDAQTRNERIRKGELMTLTVEQLKEDDRLAFDLIQSMLSSDPEKRPSADEVLRHEYLKIRTVG